MTKKSIEVVVTNIDDPTDTEKFSSIHAAMKRYKKSFKTIKNYITNNIIVNGFQWRKNDESTNNIMNIETQLNKIDEDLQKLEVELNEPLEEELEKAFGEEILKQLETDDNFIIYPYQLEPIEEHENEQANIVENEYIEEIQHTVIEPIIKTNIEINQESIKEPIKYTYCDKSKPYRHRDQCVCKIM